MAVDGIDDVRDYDFGILPVSPVDPVEKALPEFTIQPGMVEFAEAVSMLFCFDTPHPEKNLEVILAKVDRAIELDPNKCAYYVISSALHEALDQEERAIAAITTAINIAETQKTEWVLGKEGQAEEFDAIKELPSGHPQFTTAYEFELDIGELYWMRYDIYDTFDRENEPCAIADLKMAASLGDIDALDELEWRGL